MRTWCCAFSASGLLYRVVGLLLAMAGAAGAAQETAGCKQSPVFTFSQALYYAHYGEAEKWLQRINRERGSEVASFLQQVMYFKRAYDEGDLPAQQRAIERIDQQLEALQSSLDEELSIDEMLLRANTMIHASRMHLALGHVLRAARLAREGRRLLDEVMAQDALHPEALLTDGLYHYYTGSGEDSLDWAMKLFGLSGDRFHGVRQV